jgi:hypothetical protein
MLSGWLFYKTLVSSRVAAQSATSEDELQKVSLIFTQALLSTSK